MKKLLRVKNKLTQSSKGLARILEISNGIDAIKTVKVNAGQHFALCSLVPETFKTPQDYWKAVHAICPTAYPNCRIEISRS